MSLAQFSFFDPITITAASNISLLSFNRSDLSNTINITQSAAGNLTCSGTINAAGFNGTSGSPTTWTSGMIAGSASGGLANIGKTGSSYDWSVWTTNAGTAILGVPTGTTNIYIPNGSLQVNSFIKSQGTTSYAMITAGSGTDPYLALYDGTYTGYCELYNTRLGFSLNGKNLIFAVDTSGNASCTGTLTATSFSGSGAGLTGIPWSSLTGSTVPIADSYCKNLVITTTGTNSYVSVNADQVILNSGSNYLSVSVSIAATPSGMLDTGTVASSTWYSIWVISNGSATTLLMSLSSTAPTMPSGYTYKARVGWIRTDSTGNKYPLGMRQVGKTAQYVVAAGSNVTAIPAISTGNTGGSARTPSWSTTSVSNFVPPTAASINLIMRAVNSGAIFACAPNASYGGDNSTTNPPPMAANCPVTGTVSVCGSLVLESSNIYYANNDGTYGMLLCQGWIDS